jgi:iron(III) transport system substrate-binding protein
MKMQILRQYSLPLLLVLSCLAGTTVAAAEPDNASIDALYKKARQEGSLVWAVTDPESEVRAVIAAFKRRFPGIDVRQISEESSELVSRIVLEEQAGRVTIDVTDPGHSKLVVDRNIAQDLSDVVRMFGADPHLVYWGNHVWAKVLAPYGVIYNTGRLSRAEAPQSWSDVANPRFKGNIVFENRLKEFIYMTDIPAYGGRLPKLWSEARVADYLRQIKANKPVIIHGVPRVVGEVASGEEAIALTNLSQFDTALKRGAPIAVAPVSFVPAAAILHFVPMHAPHPNAAKLFAGFIMSPEGRAAWAEGRPSSDLTLKGNSKFAQAMRAAGPPQIVPLPPDINLDYGRLQKTYSGIMGIEPGGG